MEPSAALVLAGKIETTWSTRPWANAKGRDWAEALESIDEGAAGTAFARLRNNHPREPSIAEFMGVVGSIKTIGPRDLTHCAECGNSGLVQADDIVIEAETRSGVAAEPRVYSAVKPCTCAEGRQREGSAVFQEHA